MNKYLPLAFLICLSLPAIVTGFEDEEIKDTSLSPEDASFLLSRRSKNEETTCRDLFTQNMLQRQIKFSNKEVDVDDRRMAEIQIEEARKTLSETHSFCLANKKLVMLHDLPRDTEKGQIHFEGY
ncbi:hypothetical protein [Veronia pacifica]|nr:hypothetical protein [Veronia pacifica]